MSRGTGKRGDTAKRTRECGAVLRESGMMRSGAKKTKGEEQERVEHLQST